MMHDARRMSVHVDILTRVDEGAIGLLPGWMLQAEREKERENETKRKMCKKTTTRGFHSCSLSHESKACVSILGPEVGNGTQNNDSALPSQRE